MRSRLRTIAIIGGGFCGTVLAAALLRRPPLQPCRIVLIERGVLALDVEVDLPRPRIPGSPATAKLATKILARLLGEDGPG